MKFIDNNSKNNANMLQENEITASECDIGVMDKKNAIFNNCFANPFIYELNVKLPPSYYNRCLEIEESTMDEKTKGQALENLSNEKRLLYQQLLHDFIDMSLSVGEFAEIYTAWHDHINFDFAPPTLEITISLCDVLTMPTQFKHFSIEKRQKLTIHKT
jgi:hypothetical protein